MFRVMNALVRFGVLRYQEQPRYLDGEYSKVNLERRGVMVKIL